MNNITAVVVTFNRPEELRLVIKALLEQTVQLTSIIVIDNAGPLPAQDVLDPHPVLKICRLAENTGGAGGFSQGIEEALKSDSDWIWLMDDDAIPREDALEKLMDVKSASADNVGVLCSCVYEYDEIAITHRRNINFLFGLEWSLPVSKYTHPKEIQTGSFVGFFLKASVARTIGLPNVDYFLAYDDTEYSLRIQKFGFYLMLVPDSKIVHLRPKGSRLRHGEFANKHFYNVRNRIITMRQYCIWRLGAVFWATLIGIALWLRTEKCFAVKNRNLFIKSVLDGWAGKLGKI
jgi:rhamnopyranosyl-N-acetylglucosaminyl-diphospho-decaprenol beta-1,3/1,4-galactofuranosyltransferase